MAGQHGGSVVKKAAISAVAVAALVVLLLYLQGTIGGHKVAPGTVPGPGAEAPPGEVATVVKRVVPEVVEWPGTIRSRTVAQVAPKLLARILEVKVHTGEEVKQGDVIAVLDQSELRTRADQARAALAAAEAQAAQAEADYGRARALFEKQAATQADLDAAEARAKAARAQVTQARQGLAEVEVMLGETVVRAPFAGVVTEKLAEPGDMAVPGRPIAVVADRTRLRLEALVPESCARKASIGRQVAVRIDTAGPEVMGTIDEIAPTADPETRTFVIKAALPEIAGLKPGTFGRFLEECGSHEALLIPAAAVKRSGQLETVRVLQNGEWRLRNIRTGKRHGDDVEVLAGLKEGEKVLVNPG